MPGNDRIARFWHWWISTLSGMMPAVLARRWQGGPGLEVRIAPDRLHFAGPDRGAPEAVQLEGECTHLGELAPRIAARVAPGSRVDVRLDRACLLTPVLSLPDAVLRELRSALALQVASLTPFAAEEVHFQYRVLEHDRQAGRVRVELMVLPRRELARLAEALAGAGARLGDVYVDMGEGEAPASYLLAAAEGPGRRRAAGPRWVQALAAGLLVANIAWPYYRLAASDRRLETRLAELQARFEDLQRRNRGLRADQAARDWLLRRRRETPRVLEILAVLTDQLNDATHLERLVLHDDRLTLRGVSDDATALLERLSALPLFTEAQFTSAITPAGKDGRERFVLRLRLRTGGKHAH
ncbi:MAG: hypothetical protein D6721_05865 [Gammaproteobacteria bacterium]|nr:MAG: hypothetical protein D6721_05865 [Gammaproteobacteria bacterium]